MRVLDLENMYDVYICTYKSYVNSSIKCQYLIITYFLALHNQLQKQLFTRYIYNILNIFFNDLRYFFENFPTLVGGRARSAFERRTSKNRRVVF